MGYDHGVIDLAFDLRLTRILGYRHVQSVLGEKQRSRLWDEKYRLDFQPSQPTLNGVTQNFEVASSYDPDGPIGELGRQLANGVQSSGVDELAHWEPNDVQIQSYWDKNVGIGPHRDFLSDKLLVVVYNLGVATFNVHEEDGYVFTYRLYPGDVMLLAGTGFGDHPRPVHSVTDIFPGRTSITYRMSVKHD